MCQGNTIIVKFKTKRKYEGQVYIETSNVDERKACDDGNRTTIGDENGVTAAGDDLQFSTDCAVNVVQKV